MNKPKLEQVYAINEKNNITEFITTGATYNDLHYLTTPVIIGRFNISDVTLRKKYKKQGRMNKDYFFSDGRTFISENFLSKHNIKPIPITKTVRNSITNEKHTGPKFPYKKHDNSEEKENELPKQNNPRKHDENKMIAELKKMHWDEFITISTGQYKFMDQNSWDQAILDFTDLLALQTKSLKIRVAYSTEVSIDIRHQRVTKYDNNHRHIHLFLDYGGAPVIQKTLKKAFLTAMNYSKFSRYEYHSMPFQDDLFGENYILKTYKYESDCFSMCAPRQSLFK
jgi:uncharacterized protein YggL (DUF469 family)